MNNKINKAIFLDRDGTIIEDMLGYIDNPSRVKLIKGAAEAIRKLHKDNYKIIIITNQSGVGQGFFDEEMLFEIHLKMIDLLKNENAFVDDINYCPHHPSSEIDKYRISCDCRKPLPGMIIDSALKHQVDVSKSFMIGDAERDILAGNSAGCKTILINDENIKNDADYTVSSLIQAAELILKNREINNK